MGKLKCQRGNSKDSCKDKKKSGSSRTTVKFVRKGSRELLWIDRQRKRAVGKVQRVKKKRGIRNFVQSEKRELARSEGGVFPRIQDSAKPRVRKRKKKKKPGEGRKFLRGIGLKAGGRKSLRLGGVEVEVLKAEGKGEKSLED